ncbi:hypothetical protein BGZ60DRAFT_425463 [Tricladium varicosporioides]|nr:hypothetical protein BGZ60DRAFT_425463 [Hymenoscyphus varicosporioides]
MHTCLALPAALLLNLLAQLQTLTHAHPTGSTSQTLSLRNLYNDYDMSTVPSLRARIPSQLKQGNLIPHPSGTINMGSTHHHHIPLHFTISPSVCVPLTSEITPLISDLSSTILESYPKGIKLDRLCHKNTPTQITETVGMEINGNEYRATIDLVIKGEMGNREFEVLMKLLERSVVNIVEAREKAGMGRGVGTLSLGADIEGVSVEATWTFYEVVRDEAMRCRWGERETKAGEDVVGREELKV